MKVKGSIVRRVTRAGLPRFIAVVRVNGKQQWKSFTAREEAERHLKALAPVTARSGNWVEIPANFAPCVYCLYLGERIVYVGKTTDLVNRLAKHRFSLMKGKFDRVRYLVVALEDLDQTEVGLIRLYSPQFNKCHKAKEASL